MDGILLIIGTVLSIISSILLVLTWYLFPKWRSLHNFISIHQIVAGSLHMCTMNMNKDIEAVAIIKSYLYIISMCWSLCASLHAYLRLVLIYVGKISYEKRKALLFTYSIVFLVKGITDGIVKYVYNLESSDSISVCQLISVLIINSINLFIFAKIMISLMNCCKQSMSNNRAKRLMSLVGVAILCDMTLTLNLFIVILEALISNFSFLSSITFYFRVVAQAAVVLLNKNSRELWKRQFKLRKYRLNLEHI